MLKKQKNIQKVQKCSFIIMFFLMLVFLYHCNVDRKGSTRNVRNKLNIIATDKKNDSTIIVGNQIDTTVSDFDNIEFIIRKKQIKNVYLKNDSFSSLKVDLHIDTIFSYYQMIMDFSSSNDTSLLMKCLSVIQEKGYDLSWSDNDTLDIGDHGIHNLYGLGDSKIFHLNLTWKCNFYFIHSRKESKLIIFILDDMILVKGSNNNNIIKGRFIDGRVGLGHIYTYFTYKKERFYAVTIPSSFEAVKK